FLQKVLSKHVLFESFCSNITERIITFMYCVDIRKGQKITCEEEPNRGFFVVEKGRLRGQSNDDDDSIASATSVVDDITATKSVRNNSNLSSLSEIPSRKQYYKRKDVFGEKALLYGVDTSSTVEALEGCRVWALDVHVFMEITKRRNDKLQMLQSIPLFSFGVDLFFC
ncbi:hypothetical protein RFI_05327, partial [Reticulomyxa filosa]